MMEGTRGDHRPHAGSVDPSSWDGRTSISSFSNLLIRATNLRFPEAQRPRLRAAGWTTWSRPGPGGPLPSAPGVPSRAGACASRPPAGWAR